MWVGPTGPPVPVALNWVIPEPQTQPGPPSALWGGCDCMEGVMSPSVVGVRVCACVYVEQCGQNCVCVCVFATAAQAQTWRPRRCAPVVVIRPRLQDWLKQGL